MTKPIDILFADQGRALPDAAMGHVRVRHALEAGVPGDEAEIRYASVPPLSAWQKRLLRYVPRLGRALNMWSLRFVLIRSWMARRMLRKELSSARPHVVQLTTDQVSFMLGRYRVDPPCVLSLDSLYLDWVRMTNDVAPGSATPWFLRPIGALERRSLQRAPLSIAWTETIAESARELAPGARVEVLHPGIDLESFTPAPANLTPSTTTRVLFVGGSFSGRKGGDDLIAALEPRLERGVELDVLTAAELDPQAGVHVHRASPGDPKIAALFAAADVFCLPTRADACPWVILEAMAAGLAIVSTAVGSIPEMVGAGGLIVPPGDPGALREALDRLIDDPAERVRLGELGRARAVERYDARVNAPRLIKLLSSVADQARTR